MKDPIIIGAGVSGLVAAIELEKAGYKPIILEATASVGGRVKSDKLLELPIDHGFQVLLTEYPEAKHYLDYDKLDLVKFLPGSVIFKNGKMEKIGDPLRNASLLWPTLFAKVGSIKDKWLTFRLSKALKKKSLEQIFSDPETTTKAYLINYGFSAEMINNFFQPFFAGIYLEEDLETSSRMFEFVYKMFSTGNAAVPRKGMQEIPNQLASLLNNTTIHYNSPVSHIVDKAVYLKSGESLSADQIIVATDPASILNNEDIKITNWKSCYNLYLRSTKSVLKAPIIGLLPGTESIVNNFHFLNGLYKDKGQTKGTVLSVTVVKDHQLSEAEMIETVRLELQTHCNIETDELIEMFHIKKALPKVNNLKYQPTENQATLSSGIFCCGDHLANSSLNAAMASGRVAAGLVIKAGAAR